MRQVYGIFTVVGEPIPAFADQFERLAKDCKNCKFFLSIDSNSQVTAREFLALAKLSQDRLQLHEFSSAPGGSWLIAHDSTGNGLEAIVCFPPLNENSADGLYLTGSAAKAFIGCVSPLLLSRMVAGESTGPIRIYSDQQIETVLDRKTAFNQEMLDIDGGIRLSGAEAVCIGMTNVLEQTKRFLDVTHICGEKTIPLMKSEQFAAWLSANYIAAKRNVQITRIFIVPRVMRANEDLLRKVGEMKENKIKVLVCSLEDLEDRLIEDFSLYDDEHVIYISREGGAWLDEDQTRARVSDSKERVKHFRAIFNTIKQRAR